LQFTGIKGDKYNPSKKEANSTAGSNLDGKYEAIKEDTTNATQILLAKSQV